MGFEIAYEEGQTPIAEEEKRGLKLPLSTQGELDEVEQLNIEKAMVWLLGEYSLLPEWKRPSCQDDGRCIDGADIRPVGF